MNIMSRQCFKINNAGMLHFTNLMEEFGRTSTALYSKITNSANVLLGAYKQTSIKLKTKYVAILTSQH